MRRLVRILLALCLLLPAPIGRAWTGNRPSLRALLVGVDQFQSQPDTAPAARNNLRRLNRALGADSRGYDLIRQSLNEGMDFDAFLDLVRGSFEGAREGDTSLFYISTHGFYEAGQDPMSFSMLLSDGEREHLLTARELHQALAPIPGMKLVIIDTCYAGALIDRGLPGDGLRSLFTGRDFKVITASGGSEPSFFWTTGGAYHGGSYFADTLSAGLSGAGRFAADGNRDGQVTLREIHSYLLANYGVATPQVYPREDDSVLFYYDPAAPSGQPVTVSHLVLDQTALGAGDEELSFSFTLNRQARLAYQLMYQRAQQWQFARAQVIPDAELPGGESLPGRKEKTLRLTLQDQAASGYVLLFVTTVEEDSSTPWAQGLLMVEPAEGDPKLSVSAGNAFSPGKGQELSLHVAHAFPLRLSISILDAEGRVVATLVQGQPTRPEHLPDGGSIFYWTGRSADGRFVAPGLYTAQVTTTVAGERHHASSAPFRLE